MAWTYIVIEAMTSLTITQLQPSLLDIVQHIAYSGRDVMSEDV